ncbi:hybrid-cluster NAD(P)-dependent oxidoreductase [Oryzibacter oryziterrae]|uniref:hybrid-cluster NAD(P)-dependent oxidoreductase n=1 Tax=Oryzibacter oryziterrae TaxID=2766474 RepID=UPI001F222720|nr:hybrid-cluster NAD(P)-dependent oxidoreductase [Oryzibacter oryziterrae]
MTLAASTHLAAHLGDLPLWDSEADDTLVCRAVIDETADVKTFVFEGPEPRRFAYKPGQFLTISVEIGGETVNRCYTISSTPTRPNTVAITVKRVPGGIVANWLHDNLKPGGTIKGIGPMGEFSCLNDAAPKYLFLSGGSGITPLMSMSRALADLGRPVDVVFVHACRTPKDIIFRAELDLIAARLPGFRVIHLPERQDGEAGWAGATGRISADFFKLFVPDFATRSVWCCGPAPFMKAAKTTLGDLGAPTALYHEESFDFGTLTGGAAEPVAEAAVEPGVATYKITFAKSGQVVEARADQFVIATARAAGVPLPASCSEGLCGTCKSKLVSGTVDMNHKGGIRKKEIDQGLFLPCCSKPTSDLVIER